MEERKPDNKKEAKTKVLLWFTFAYFLFFIIKTVVEKNQEFFVYGIAMLAVMIAIYFYRHELNLSLTSLVFLSMIYKLISSFPIGIKRILFRPNIGFLTSYALDHVLANKS